MSLRKKILEIDIELKNNYENKRINEEFKLFDKAKKIKNVLYNCTKQKQKLLTRLDPLSRITKSLNMILTKH